MNKDWKIYTKTGDRGETALIGGKRVKKYHPRIEAYGTVDELNSYLGLIRDSVSEKDLQDFLLQIQNKLFVAESLLATDSFPEGKSLPQLNENDVFLLEKEIDKINETLPVLNNFILPGGYIINSYCHIARCVCRRAERLVVFLSEEFIIAEVVVKYLNRLSDYLFVLARKVSWDAGAKETVWITGE